MSISTQAYIHPTAIVSSNANIAANVHIGPFCTVEDEVTIDSGTILVSHVVVKGKTTIGKDNKIFSFVIIGEESQHLNKGDDSNSQVIIGHRNLIREHCTIHKGTKHGLNKTVIGDDNLLMVNTHIAHDCILGNRNVIANNVCLGGHVVIDNFVVIGGSTGIHQFVNIGSHVMIGGCSAVSQDIPPYLLVQGNHAYVIGINSVGLTRRGFDNYQKEQIKTAFRILYRQGKTIENAIVDLEHLSKQTTCISLFVEFLNRASNRGIVRPQLKPIAK